VLISFFCVCTLTHCAENFIEAPLSSSDTTPLTQTPTPIVGDGFATRSGVALSRTLDLTWTSGASATSWCVSESQDEPPILACDGGQGEVGGWSATAPTRYTLAAGDGAKVLYVWVRDASGTLIPIPSVVPLFLVEAAGLIPFNDGSGTSVTEILGLPVSFFPGSGGRWIPRGIQLDGNTSYIDLGAPNALRFTGSFSISMWVKSFQSGGQILLGRYDPFSNNKAYRFQFTPTALQFEITKDGTSAVGKMARVQADYNNRGFLNRWRHITAVYQARGDGASRLALYVDGIKADETTTAPGSIYDPNGLKILIGMASDLSSYAVSGQVGSVAFVGSPLTDQVIQALFAAQKPFYP
jgi:hypothetical protein